MPSNTYTFAEAVNGLEKDKDSVITSILAVPVIAERRPFLQPEDDQRLPHTGALRANIAATYAKPRGTIEASWAERHQDQTALQQQCDFFDQDGDGVIWPVDTFRVFHQLGFGLILSLVAVFIICANFAYPTSSSLIPDPLFRVYINNIHKAKHGSDSNTYDTEGRFVPQKFEDIFAKYGKCKDSLTLSDIWRQHKG